MPNGGYPMHLQLPMAEGLGLAVSGEDVVLARLNTKADREDFLDAVPLGALSDEQRRALLFHLLYWSGGGDLPAIQIGRLRAEPHYGSAECFYSF